MSIMDSHPHSSLGRGNAACPAFFDNPATTQPPTVTALTPTTTENTNPSSSTTHSHHHHNNHHQFVDSSTVYHHPFRTITPNSAESNNRILDPQPQSKSSTPTNQHQTQSRPGSGSTPDWTTAGIGQPQAPQPATSRRAFSSNTSLDGPASREPPQAPSGTGTGYHSPTATPASRRSSSNPNPSPNSNELIPATATPTSTAAPPYYQHQSSQDPNLAMIAAIDCSGLDVRPMYSSEESRHTPGQGQTQSPHQGHAQNNTRAAGPSPEEVRTPYYSSLPATHYPSAGATILPSHYSHAPSPLPLQSGQRRTASSSTVGSAYGPYHSLSVPAPIGATPYGHHHHHHHPEGNVAPSWTPAVDSVRDTVSPYTRPPRAPASGSLGGHHQSSSSSYGQPIRNGPLLHSQPSNTSAAHHHQPGTMQYNAQGRPLAYMCITCLRAFDRPSALQIHERSHTGERPFPCPWNGCVKRFTTHGNMVKHSRVCPFREPDD